MAGDPTKKDHPDRSCVADNEDHEVQYLAKKAGISAGAARALIKMHGNDRATLRREAKRLQG